MAIRSIIRIDEEKCDGCGDCVSACAEGAIQMIDGKAKLVSDVYCDGLGACIGDCHVDAITIEEREADEFDEVAVEQRLKDLGRDSLAHHQKLVDQQPAPVMAGGCPGSRSQTIDRSSDKPLSEGDQPSRLGQWPVQLMLVPPHAPFLAGTDILLCADCVPFALNNFHDTYLSGKSLLVGCPKLDDLNHYHQKLIEIFQVAKPKSVTVLKMEVPCCNGIAQVAVDAHQRAIPDIPISVETVTIDGKVQSDSNQSGLFTV